MDKTGQANSGVRAVIFDISGTVLDYGSRAPVAAFLELFARHGVTISADEARGPMGAHKKDHIWALLNTPALAERWSKANGGTPSHDDLGKLYAEFTPLQTEMVKRHCDVIPGVLETVAELRRRGIRIANTTGYDTCMVTDLIRLAAEAGYTPDLWVCPDMVGQGRPAPWMAFFAAKELDVYPMRTFVKVGDTPSDIAEAHAAGMWAVSVTRSGNQVGLSQEEFAALPELEQHDRLAAARASLAASGPHYIIDSVADLMPVVDDITARLARGERP
jgi:phosphonoacetaldehyde hydrolase